MQSSLVFFYKISDEISDSYKRLDLIFWITLVHYFSSSHDEALELIWLSNEKTYHFTMPFKWGNFYDTVEYSKYRILWLFGALLHIGRPTIICGSATLLLVLSSLPSLWSFLMTFTFCILASSSPSEAKKEQSKIKFLSKKGWPKMF